MSQDTHEDYSLNTRFLDLYKKLKSSGWAKNKTVFAQSIGMPREYMSLIEKNKRLIPVHYFKKLKEVYDLSQKYIDTGEGPMYENERPDYRKVNAAQGFSGPEEEKNIDLETPAIKDFAKSSAKRQDLQLIPLYDITAAAGLNAIHNSNQNILDYLRIPNLTRCDGAIYIKGDSMYPLLKHGDIVAFQKITDIPDDIYFGEMYVVDLSTPHLEKIVVKYIQKSEKGPEYITLVSYNEKHHPPKDVHLKKVRGMAEVKASIRLT